MVVPFVHAKKTVLVGLVQILLVVGNILMGWYINLERNLTSDLGTKKTKYRDISNTTAVVFCPRLRKYKFSIVLVKAEKAEKCTCAPGKTWLHPNTTDLVNAQIK